MKELFNFNRKYIKEVERDKVDYNWGKIISDFHSALKIMPIDRNEVWSSKPYMSIDKTTGEEKIIIEETVCHNLDEQLKFLSLRWIESDSEYKVKKFLFPYTTMFLAAKNYSDDELSYLYITGMEFINPWSDDIENPRNLLSEQYTRTLTRIRVIDIVAFLLVLAVLIYDCGGIDCSNQYFDLEEYEEELYE